MVFSVAEGQLKHGDPAVTVVHPGNRKVNVRSEPRVSRETFVRQVAAGTQLKRIGKRSGWYRVLLPDGVEAWISGTYAQPGVARDILVVKPSHVNVRKSPSTSSDRVAAVTRGDRLPKVEKQNNWYRLILPNGRRGWIRSDMVTLEPVFREREPKAKPEPKAASKEKDPPPPPAKKVDFFQLAMDLVEEKRLKEATDAFRAVLKTRPDDGEVHFELGKILDEMGDREGATVHFRAALRGEPPRPEARFYLDAILRSGEDTTEVDVDAGVEEAETDWYETLMSNAGYLFPASAIGTLSFIVALALVYRRRMAARQSQPTYRRRKPDAGFDSVLKYAVEKRPLLRSIEEAERKRSEMDVALQERFNSIGEAGTPGANLPTVESTEALIKRVEALRQTILNQEERAQVYADLVVLQNQKIQALDEEVAALKRLIMLDYRGKKKGG